MSYFKKTLALVLVVAMVFSLAACGDKEKKGVKKSKLYQDETRDLYIGSWYEQYYTSAHQNIDDNPEVDDRDLAEMSLNNMREVEQRYNIELYYDVLTWDACIASINTSIMAGAPECDVYMVDLQFGIPAVLAGYAYSLEYILQETQEAKDGKIDEKYLDVLSDKGSEVISTIKFTTDNKTYLFGQKQTNTGAYVVGYNKDILAEYGLDDPYELWEKNEWTWDKWNEMMVATTKDKDGDGVTDQWGFRGPWTTLSTHLLMSNGTNIATTTPDEDGIIREKLTSNATTEALNQLSRMYQTDKVAYWDASCDENFDAAFYDWAKGNVAFWITTPWIVKGGDPDQTMTESMGMVPFPVGPSGNKDTNKSFNATTGSYFIIPAGIENPALIYCVMYDYFNWYGDDLDLRDDTSWAEQWSYNEQNFNVLVSCADEAKDIGFELMDQITWDSSYTIRAIIQTGSEWDPCTVAEFQQANKNIVQDFLDTNFNK